MSILLKNACILTPFGKYNNAALAISDNGKISKILDIGVSPVIYDQEYDFGGKYLIPGLIDIHVHGGFGVRFMDQESLTQDLERYAKWVVKHGVTGFLCSVMCPTKEQLIEAVEKYVAVFEKGSPGAEYLGLHLEGPFLSKKVPGAIDPNWIRKPDMDEALALTSVGKGWIKQITMAPEEIGNLEIAAHFRENKIKVAIGHSFADYEISSQALRNDFTHVTHTFNGQRGFSHRDPGVVGAVLESEEVTAELIADLFHVHPAAINILIACLGADQIVLITDAMSAAGLSDGTYTMSGRTRIVKNGQSRTPDGKIAGSTATLDQCMRNIHQVIHQPLEKAVQMASYNPAKAIKLENRLGSIREGKDASLTVLDADLRVCMTIVNGVIVYKKECD